MLSAMDDDGKAVDWWFAYKLPHDAVVVPGATKETTTGFEYLYADAHRHELARSPNTMDQRAGALFHTLDAIVGGEGRGHIFYNDELPTGKANDGRKGHAKGVLAFDLKADQALWLVHSTPRFPAPREHDLPDEERQYAQTYLCITLPGVDAAREIAAVLATQHEPQVYAVSLPEELGADDPLRQLAGHLDLATKADPADLKFQSKAGEHFRLLAKSRNWGDDLWTDLVSETLGVDIEVETWRRGKLFGTEDADGKHDVIDTLWIDLRPVEVDLYWEYTKDHSKWGTSKEGDWVVVADINRQASQGKRGGGAVCFRHPGLWKALSKIESVLEPK